MKDIELSSGHRSTTGKDRWGQWIKSCLLPLLVVSALTLSNGCRRGDAPAPPASTATKVLVYYGLAMPMWGESNTIPASGRHRRHGELFINFLLRPEITAQIINEKKYAQPHDPAIQMISQEIRNDPVIFPGDRELRKGSIIQPLSPEGKKLYADIWTRFKAGSR